MSATTGEMTARVRAARARRSGWIGRLAGRVGLAGFLLVWMLPLYWLVNTTFKFKAQIQSEVPLCFH